MRTIIVILVLSFSCFGQTLISNVGSGNAGPTSAVNTTGATLLTVWCLNTSSSVPTVTDNKSNTWHYTTAYGTSSGSTGFITVAYSYGTGSGPTVGSGHTFTCSSAMTILANSWSSIQTSSDPKDGSVNGAAVSSGSTGQPGSITPTSGDLVLAGWVSGYNYGENPTVNSSFSLYALGVNNTYNYDAALAWRLAPGTALNPTWTQADDTAKAMNIIAFKAAAAPAAVNPPHTSNF